MYKEADFQRFLKKLALTLSESYRVMGLPENTTDENAIKLKYRELVKKFHPDLGGSPKKMVELNQAKDRIDLAIKNREFSRSNTRTKQTETNKTKYDNTKSEPKYEKREEKSAETELELKLMNLKKQVIGRSLEYIKYFEEKTGMKPRFFYKEKLMPSAFNQIIGDSFEVDFKFKFEDGSECSLKIRYSGRSDLYFYNSDVYYKNRLYPMQQSKYNEVKEDGVIIFSIPSHLFTSLKLTRIFGDKKDKAFSKKDAIAMLEKEIFAKKSDTDTWRIAINTTQDIVIKRLTFMKVGQWYITGLWEKHRKVGSISGGIEYFFETIDKTVDDNFYDLIGFLKKAKAGNVKWVSPK